MKTFSSALKSNISRYGFKNAMARTWQEVRQGKVARPPRGKKTARKPKTIRTRNKKKNPRSQKFFTIRYPDGQFSQTFATLKATQAYNKRSSVKGVILFPFDIPKKTDRKNPIVIYNPKNPKLIYAKAFIPEIRGTKGDGERYRHKFKNEVSIYGLPDGSFLVKPKKGQRLWANESDVDKYDRT